MKRSILIGVFFIIVFFFSYCKKFVTVDLPVTKLATGSVFSDDLTATSAQLAIYLGMSNSAESYFMASNSGLLSDELINYSINSDQIELYHNAMDPIIISSSTGCWADAYNYIYQANSIIGNIQQSENISNAVKNQLSGESKFIRAFWHFYLTNCYGDIPLVTSTAYTVNGVISRTPRMMVYRQIINDLKDAENLLNSSYVDITDTASATAERVRPMKAAASALLARTYLYNGVYDSAEIEATSVINNPLYVLEPNLNNVFLITSREAIWQLQTPAPFPGTNTPDAGSFILLGAPNATSISSYLLGAFEPGDNRRNNWIQDTVFDGSPYSYAYKYKVINGPAGIASEYVTVLRLAEQYLIRAEARAWQGNLIGSNSAISDLNSIRQRAGLGIYTGNMSKDSILAAILHERQVELFTEWGHRWFDLIRTKNVNAVMSVVTPHKGGSWNMDGHQSLYPIPQTERSNDPNLSQNPGY